MKKIMQKIVARIFRNKIAVNVNRTDYHKDCLLLYVVAPFLTQQVGVGHQNQWQAKELARIIGTFGFNVDVINYDNQRVMLRKRYDLVVDLHPGFNESYSEHMSPGCLKIAYITGSNPDFSNQAEKNRLTDLCARRGVMLIQRRHASPFIKESLESFDSVFFIGNAYNLQTYKKYMFKHLSYIRNNGISFPVPSDKKTMSPTCFMFLASVGQVHKGLDLLLEVFSRCSHLTLYVCSSFKREKDFCRLYGHELFHSANIVPVGFIDVTGNDFQAIAAQCGYLLLPSCSEANASSVLTGMSAGLVPIVSRECGFEDDEVHYFPDCSIETITATVNELSRKSIEWLQVESDKARFIVETRYSASAFSTSVQVALKELFDEL